MKIALINENSQAAKNGIIEAALKKVVEPMGHEVVNYGMYAADDAAQLTYCLLYTSQRPLTPLTSVRFRYGSPFYSSKTVMCRFI